MILYVLLLIEAPFELAKALGLNPRRPTKNIPFFLYTLHQRSAHS